MSHDCMYCQDCEVPIEKWSEFLAHANQGHALTWGVSDGT